MARPPLGAHVRRWVAHRVGSGGRNLGDQQALRGGECGGRAPSEWGLSQCLAGGLLGGATHPLLDGIMHSDIEPLRPFASGNPFLGFVELGLLQLLCVAAGAVGVVLLFARSARLRSSVFGTDA
jgi:hypothetical protein